MEADQQDPKCKTLVGTNDSISSTNKWQEKIKGVAIKS